MPEQPNLLYHFVALVFFTVLLWPLVKEPRSLDNYNSVCSTKYISIKRKIRQAKSKNELSDIEDEIHAFYAEFKNKVGAEMLTDLNGELWAAIQNKLFELTGKVLVSN